MTDSVAPKLMAVSGPPTWDKAMARSAFLKTSPALLPKNEPAVNVPISSKRAKGAPTFAVTELLVNVPKRLLLNSKPVVVVSSVTAPNDRGCMPTKIPVWDPVPFVETMSPK